MMFTFKVIKNCYRKKIDELLTSCFKMIKKFKKKIHERDKIILEVMISTLDSWFLTKIDLFRCEKSIFTGMHNKFE